MVRLFLLAENTVASVSAKILCGARYLDGSAPRSIVTAASMPNARILMKQHGRRRQKHRLLWTQAREIVDNLKYTLDPQDPLFAAVGNHGAAITEMRYVRNHIVHRNSGTLVNFRKVVRSFYGGLRQGVTPGLLLMTDAFGPQTLLEKYIVYAQVFVKDLVRV